MLSLKRIIPIFLIITLLVACGKKEEGLQPPRFVYVESTLQLDTMIFQDPNPFVPVNGEKPFLLYSAPGLNSGTPFVPRGYLYKLVDSSITMRMLGGGEDDPQTYYFATDSAATTIIIQNYYDRPELNTQFLEFNKISLK
ncbi:hypothetical protein COR50_08980 [Chitinophaga caeni]|uniref:Uncharacterized protein n=1 Tax=Chitinophaga caeni TaxID=2029983 RepID=A0A291QTW7_9BACT|nr:hypothetical protein [Chitinophaga caeni]ATL47294.1 hypothetical protein COR50_08980 [Chitinophaga caeni]